MGMIIPLTAACAPGHDNFVNEKFDWYQTSHDFTDMEFPLPSSDLPLSPEPKYR